MCRVVCLIGTLLLGSVAMSTGCTPPGPTRVKVSGTVKYSDGTAPTGEVRFIRFEPVSQSSANIDIHSKTASGFINPDGTFQLTTVDPNDGALPGEYKVTFTIKQTPSTSEMLVAPEFLSAQTTPFTRTVKVGDANQFDFTIEKSK